MSGYFCETHRDIVGERRIEEPNCRLLRIRECRVDGRLIAHLYEERCDECGGKGEVDAPDCPYPGAGAVGEGDIHPCFKCDKGWRLRAEPIVYTHGKPGEKWAVVMLEQEEQDV